ncbi:MAG: hypothetical protein P8188_11965 [Gemmatimonadota bacterium]
MTADQNTELIAFLAEKFGRIDEGFDGLGGRLVKVEVGLGALRDDVRALAEELETTNERMDRLHQDHEIRIQALEAHWLQA